MCVIGTAFQCYADIFRISCIDICAERGPKGQTLSTKSRKLIDKTQPGAYLTVLRILKIFVISCIVIWAEKRPKVRLKARTINGFLLSVAK